MLKHLEQHFILKNIDPLFSRSKLNCAQIYQPLTGLCQLHLVQKREVGPPQ